MRKVRQKHSWSSKVTKSPFRNQTALWRVNQTGEECFGFRCRNIVEHRSKSFHLQNGLSGESRCDVKSIPEWRLQYQLMRILQTIWEEPEKDAEYMEAVIAESYEAEDTFVDETPRIAKQIDIFHTCQHRQRSIISRAIVTLTFTELSKIWILLLKP